MQMKQTTLFHYKVYFVAISIESENILLMEDCEGMQYAMNPVKHLHAYWICLNPLTKYLFYNLNANAT